jgi:hypothetical protein
VEAEKIDLDDIDNDIDSDMDDVLDRAKSIPHRD